MTAPPFAPILQAAQARHGAPALSSRLAQPRAPAELEALGDDRYLSQMSLRVFRAGLKHSLVDAKWPAFEEVFGGFDSRVIRFQAQSNFWLPKWYKPNIPLFQERLGGRIALLCEIDMPGHPLTVFNVHLESRGADRLRVAQLTETLASGARYPAPTAVIVAGDMNLDVSQRYRRLRLARPASRLHEQQPAHKRLAHQRVVQQRELLVGRQRQPDGTGYTTTTGNEQTASPGYTYTYDADGNMITATQTSTGDVWTYSYDFRNRMTGAVEKTSGGTVLAR